MSSDIETRSGSRPIGLIALNLVKKLLSCVESGRLTVRTPDGTTLNHQAEKPGPEAVLVLHRWRALRRLVTGGDTAFAEAYMDGDWSTPDLSALLELGAANIAPVERRVAGLLPVRIANRIRHILRPNSKRGSKRNIAYHYDLGNEFYRLWLDPSMTYSSALYENPTDTLEAAQENKLRRIVDHLAPKSGDEVLEIGCGWGTLAARLGSSGANVKAITLSAEQLAYAKRAVADKGLSDRVRLELQDYRDCQASFDRIVSIEMLEAVGEQYWPTYFNKVRQLLTAQGKAVLQVITIDESRYDQYRKGADFIQKYVFPGGMLPTKTLMADHAAKAGLTLARTEFFGRSYALTLAEWRQRFRHGWPPIEKLGFDQRFRRLWEYYLAYCEAGFRTGLLDVGLYVLEPAPSGAAKS